MDGLKTNTQKKHFHIAVSLDGKLVATFGARTDSVLNALKSAYEQCCGYTQKPIEPLPEPPKSVEEDIAPAPKKRGRKPKEKVEPTPPPISEPKKRGRKPKNAKV